MTRKPPPIPPHGTEARYKGNSAVPGCRCPRCTKAATRATTERELDRIQGRGRRVPSGPSWDHVLLLRAADLNDTQIAEAAGIHQTHVARIGTRPTVSRITAERILSVPLNHRPQHGKVPAVGATRRLRALYVLDHSRDELAVRIGISADYVARIARGEFEHVLAEHDRAIRRVYAFLSTTRGTSHRTGPHARRQGWHGPMAWHKIDDPDEKPSEPEPAVELLSKQDLATLRTEEIEHLASFGVSNDEIARRTGLTPGYVRDQLAGSRKPGWREKASA